MNEERILAVADAIENNTVEDTEFDMGTFGEHTSCNTLACIAGYAMAMYEPRKWWDFLDNGKSTVNPEEEGAKILDLNDYQAATIFYATHLNEETAPAALRAYVETKKLEVFYDE